MNNHRWSGFHFLCASLFLVVLLAPLRAQASAELNVMPLPANCQMGSGSLKIDGAFSVVLAGYKEPRLERALDRFTRQLSRQTGLVLPHGATDPAQATLVVTTDHQSKLVQEPGEDESYALEVTPGSAKIHAATPLGAMHGLQTFLQLISISAKGFIVPAVNIQDQARFV